MRIEVSDRQDAVRLGTRRIERIMTLALGLHERDADLSVALVGDREMAELNERFLGRASTTDVLAFPYGCQGETIHGEIVVNAELAVRQAAERTHEPQDELMLYLVHGLLHLLGCDDRDPADARLMRWREQEILQAAGRRVQY